MTVQMVSLTTRLTGTGQEGVVAELGGGKDNLVAIVAVHYGLDFIEVDANADRLVQLGMSSNPEHENVGAGGITAFVTDPAVYAKATLTHNHDGIGDSAATEWSHEVPCYGLVRPRRQIWVLGLVTAATVGFWAEVWYDDDVQVSQGDRDAVNRKYGKYRRS